MENKGRKGFLPMDTNWFDRFFIGLITHVALNLLWLRFLEQSIPLIVATILGIIWIIVVMKWG
jgi:predicted small integral membrane protein